MRRFSEAEKAVIWDMREAGVPVKRIANHLGRQNVSLRKFIADAGGKRPTRRERSELRLSLAEREEISRGLAAGLSLRAIAAGLGRSPSTVRREVNANGGACAYRALRADRAAQRRALRPRPAKLARCRRLRRLVERKLEATWSPEQISAWLASEYPEDPEMQVSHERVEGLPVRLGEHQIVVVPRAPRDESLVELGRPLSSQLLDEWWRDVERAPTRPRLGRVEHEAAAESVRAVAGVAGAAWRALVAVSALRARTGVAAAVLPRQPLQGRLDTKRSGRKVHVGPAQREHLTAAKSEAQVEDPCDAASARAALRRG